MSDQSVDILRIRVQPIQLVYELFYMLFLKIQFAGIALLDNILLHKLFPDLLILKDKTFRENHVTTIIQNHIQTK